ncbi:SDR family oxidoreductase [Streptomyces sp. NPDC045456]|uniref:SDR family oxidoreductase n=1 Tax=Streptomyces sp. NPDC045456 TaxID=3155254 RepID=UPI0033E59FB9
MLALTGATGFFGSHFLAAYLTAHPRARIIVLGRDAPRRTRDRLHTALRATGRPLDSTHLQRVTPLRINLADECLGLDSRAYTALADRITALCHFAGHIGLDAPLDVLRTVNVTGTAHLLHLARAAGPRLSFLHISTAYVAGTRRCGTAPEAIIRPPEGFLSPYEESKYEAECLVHQYAARTGRLAVIARPSLLVTDRPQQPGAPQSPLRRLGAGAANVQRISTRAGERGLCNPECPVTARIPGAPHATLNLLQVEHAAQAAVHLSRCTSRRRGSAKVVHLVHPHQVAIPALLDALTTAHLPGLRLTLTAQVTDPTPLEKLLQHMSQGAHLYTHLNRRYDRTQYLRHLRQLPDPPDLTPAYLLRAFAPPGSTAPPRPLAHPRSERNGSTHADHPTPLRQAIEERDRPHRRATRPGPAPPPATSERRCP